MAVCGGLEIGVEDGRHGARQGPAVCGHRDPAALEPHVARALELGEPRQFGGKASRIGAVPAPVSALAGSSKKRGRPDKSVVMPGGTAALLPASTAGEPELSRQSPPPAFTKSGLELLLPVPGNPP